MLRHRATNVLAVGAATAEPVALTVHPDRVTGTVDAGIYGQFLEHIFNSVHGGLWGDLVLNGSWQGRSR
jgi:hypothetical protein